MDIVLLFTMLSVIFFSVILYGKLSDEINTFNRFDILFFFLLSVIIISRIFGIMMQSKGFDVGFSVNPLTQTGDIIEVFSKWPWIFFRFWDKVFSVEYFFLNISISLILTIKFFGQFIKDKLSFTNSIVLSAFVVYAFVTFAQYFLNLTIIPFGLSLGSINAGTLQLIITTLILLVCILTLVYDKKASVFLLIFLIWGLVDLVKKLFSSEVKVFDLYYLESFVLIGLSLLFMFKEYFPNSVFKRKETKTGRFEYLERRKTHDINYQSLTRNTNKPSFMNSILSKNRRSMRRDNS